MKPFYRSLFALLTLLLFSCDRREVAKTPEESDFLDVQMILISDFDSLGMIERRYEKQRILTTENYTVYCYFNDSAYNAEDGVTYSHWYGNSSSKTLI